MKSNRSGLPHRLRPALLALTAGLAATGCGEQRLLSGADISPPIVAITKTGGDTRDVAAGLQFSVSAADNLGLKNLTISLTGGFTATIDSTFRTAVTTVSLPVTVTFPKNTAAA